MKLWSYKLTKKAFNSFKSHWEKWPIKKLFHCDEDGDHDEGTAIATTSDLKKKKNAIAPIPSVAILGENDPYWERVLCYGLSPAKAM